MDWQNTESAWLALIEFGQQKRSIGDLMLWSAGHDFCHIEMETSATSLIAVHWTWTPYMAESFSLSNRRRRTTKTTFKHWTTACLDLVCWWWLAEYVGLADDWKADQGPFKHYSQLHTNYNIRKIKSYSLIIQFTTTIYILNIRFRTTVLV